MNDFAKKVYVAAHEVGSHRSDLPLWASCQDNPLLLNKNFSQGTKRLNIAGVPGAFQILNVLDKEDCKAFVKISEDMGYTEDAAVSLDRNIRHNMNLNWIIDDETHDIIWSRIYPLLLTNSEDYMGRKPLGLNQRFRFYRYKKNDYFALHTDGAWPGSKMVNGTPVLNAFGDRFSMYTLLIFLNEDFGGGETQFLIDNSNPRRPAKSLESSRTKSVRTPTGGVLCFPHGMHPLHCLHASEKINSGVKYIIRTDVLFSQ